MANHLVLAPNGSDFKKRFLTTIIGIPLIVISVYCSFFFYVVCILGILACYEWNNITKKPFISTLSYIIPVYCFFYTSVDFKYVSLMFFCSYFFIFFMNGWRFGCGFTYITCGIFGLLLIVKNVARFDLIMILIALIWCGDICAYFCGKVFKGPKLAPNISPNKTWSGLIGGTFIPTILISFIIYFQYDHFFDWLFSFCIFLVSLSGHIGDLIQSKAKRFYGVKDSGNLFPGHGGVLDRIDSFLPIGALYVLMIIIKLVINIYQSI